MITGEKTTVVRVIIVLLTITLLISSVACSLFDIGEGEYDNVIDINNFSFTSEQDSPRLRYAIIVASDCSAEIYAAASSLAQKLETAGEADAAVFYDYEAPKSESAFELIYVGSIDKDECVLFFNGLDTGEFGYARINGRIVIGGHSDHAVLAAIEQFEKRVISSDKGLPILSEGDRFVDALNGQNELPFVNGFALSEYVVVYSDADGDAKAVSEALSREFEERFGHSINVLKESECHKGQKAICIGRTEKAETADFVCRENEAVIAKYDKGISVISDSAFGLLRGTERLCELLSSEDNELELSASVFVGFESEKIEFLSVSCANEELSYSEILELYQDIDAQCADIVRIEGVSPSSFQYLFANLSRSYYYAADASESLGGVYYLYLRQSIVLTEVETDVGSSSVCADVCRTRNKELEFYLVDFSDRETVNEETAEAVSSLINKSENRGVLAVGALSSGEETALLSICRELTKYTDTELSFGVYIGYPELSLCKTDAFDVSFADTCAFELHIFG